LIVDVYPTGDEHTAAALRQHRQTKITICG
jgi:hypothetical protein